MWIECNNKETINMDYISKFYKDDQINNLIPNVYRIIFNPSDRNVDHQVMNFGEDKEKRDNIFNRINGALYDQASLICIDVKI